MLETKFSDRFKNERFFIPMVSVYTKPLFFKAILPFTRWIGFNYFEIIHSNHYLMAKTMGLRKAFGIDDKTYIFLSTAAKDKLLVKFYDNEKGLETFKSDMKKLKANLVMGPDWFSYKEDPLFARKEVVTKAIELNSACLSIDNLVPTIRGTNFSEMSDFVRYFKDRGVKVFVFAGREYLINLGDRKRAQQEAFLLTQLLVKKFGIRLLLTGCSSPLLHRKLQSVSGFAGQGWLIQAKQRRLLKGNTYVHISNKAFSCNDSDCCRFFRNEDLKNEKCDFSRAIHNLKRINSFLRGQKAFTSQTCLEEF
jgi:hypothetical protein